MLVHVTAALRTHGVIVTDRYTVVVAVTLFYFAALGAFMLIDAFGIVRTNKRKTLRASGYRLRFPVVIAAKNSHEGSPLELLL